MLKVYRNEAWDLIDNFFLAFNIYFIPRDHNQTMDSLALAATYFKIPKVSYLKYPIELRYRPSVLDKSNIGKCSMMIWKLRNFQN